MCSASKAEILTSVLFRNFLQHLQCLKAPHQNSKLFTRSPPTLTYQVTLDMKQTVNDQSNVNYNIHHTATIFSVQTTTHPCPNSRSCSGQFTYYFKCTRTKLLPSYFRKQIGKPLLGTQEMGPKYTSSNKHSCTAEQRKNTERRGGAGECRQIRKTYFQWWSHVRSSGNRLHTQQGGCNMS